MKMVADDNKDLLSVVSNSGIMPYMCQPPPPPPPPPAPPIPQPPPENADEGDETQENNSICRDFLRGSCTRPMCKFPHFIEGNLPKDQVNFCHDYQNGKCVRGNCKFIHCSMKEEDEFFRTGKLPPSVVQRFNSRLQNSQPKPDAPPPLPSHMMEMHYVNPVMPPLPPQPHMVYGVPPPPPLEQWMPPNPPAPRETLDFAMDMSQRRVKRSRFQDLDGCIQINEGRHIPPDYMMHCSNCTKLLRANAEIEEKVANLTEKCKQLEEKNIKLTSNLDLLLDKSTKLMNMLAKQAITSAASHTSQTILTTTLPPQPVQRVHILKPSSSGEQLVIASMPSSIREDMISSNLVVNTIPAYKTTVMRPPFRVSGSMDGNVYSTATLGKGLVESGQQLIMTPRCNEIQQVQTIPSSMVLSSNQIHVIPVTKAGESLLDNTIVLQQQPQQLCGTSQAMSMSSSHQSAMPYYHPSYNNS